MLKKYLVVLSLPFLFFASPVKSDEVFDEQNQRSRLCNTISIDDAAVVVSLATDEGVHELTGNSERNGSLRRTGDVAANSYAISLPGVCTQPERRVVQFKRR